jgi:hypothetical protein
MLRYFFAVTLFALFVPTNSVAQPPPPERNSCEPEGHRNLQDYRARVWTLPGHLWSPVRAEVIESGGLLLPPGLVAAYLVKVTESHPDFKKGETVQIYLQLSTKVVRGTDRVAAKSTGWAKGTRVILERYEGIQKSKPPQVYPEVIVLED